MYALNVYIPSSGQCFKVVLNEWWRYFRLSSGSRVSTQMETVEWKKIKCLIRG